MPQKYRHLNDADLEKSLKSKFSDACNGTVDVIEILEEFERRKLYLKLGYRSLLEYCVQELKAIEKKEVVAECGAAPPVVFKKYVSAPLRREVWRKAEGKCCFVSTENQLRCNSVYQLEVDHIVPLALGGTSTIENLRLVCRAHNQHYARIEFGEEFMSQFEKSS